ncbi:MAG: acyl carrier protein [Deltaproteobacteria bacterium]|nr:acyl carrier protein [Deltaproteobacteria bacterium]
MSAQIEKEVISIISDVAEVDTEEVALDSDLVKDLGINSIKAIEIVVALEKKYKVSIRDEDVPKITTPGQIISLTESLITKRAMSNA